MNGFSTDSFLGKGNHDGVHRAALDNGKLIAMMIVLAEDGGRGGGWV